MIVGVSVALRTFSALVLSLLPLALITSSKGYPLYPISTSSFTLAGFPQFRSCLYYYPFYFYKYSPP